MANFSQAERELHKIESTIRLKNPETAHAEIQRLVDEELAAQGFDLSALQASADARRRESEGALRERVRAAANEFMSRRPETDAANGYLPIKANENVLLYHMQSRGLDFTSAYDYEQAFLAVRDRLIPPQGKTRQRRAVRTVGGIEISHEALDRMTSEEMARATQNPAFLNAVNQLPPRVR